MTDIRYVCLSDMHLGEEDSLLTNLKAASRDTDPTEPSPVLRKLVDCLRFLISKNENAEKPTLILNGDILEMALTTTNEAAMVFERFVELILPKEDPLFKEIIYVPGNHDHHLWESGRETQYVNYFSTLDWGKNLPVPWHATNMFSRSDTKRVPSYFLTTLLRRFNSPRLEDFTVWLAYPNFGLLSEDQQTCVMFHHGHFVESIYKLMSTLKTLLFPDRGEPRAVWDLEAENFAWIDFFWSTMGRSGEVGSGVEIIYEKLGSAKGRDEIITTLSKSLAARYDLPGWGDRIEAWLAKGALKAVANALTDSERSQTGLVLTKDAEEGLWAYMNGPLRNQVLGELGHNMPRTVSFVFGHTHKPFEKDMNFRNYPQWVDTYNTGGWVVETVDPEPLHGGAAVLVAEDLSVTSLRLFNECDEPSEYRVSVQEATHQGETPSAFHERITSLVDPSQSPWKEISAAVARAVRIRAQNLKARINEQDPS